NQILTVRSQTKSREQSCPSSDHVRIHLKPRVAREIDFIASLPPTTTTSLPLHFYQPPLAHIMSFVPAGALEDVKKTIVDVVNARPQGAELAKEEVEAWGKEVANA